MDKSKELELLLLEQERRRRQAPSAIESATKGAVQGATGGWGDEISGGIGVGLDYAQRGLNALGLADKSPGQVSAELASKGITGDIGPVGASDIYKQSRDEERKANDVARSANPESYMVGEIAGGSALFAASPLNLPTLGGIQGAGVSDKDTLQGAAIGAASGAAVGSLGSALGKGLGAVAESAAQTAPFNASTSAISKNAGLIGGLGGMVSHGPMGGVAGATVGKEAIQKSISAAGPLINKADQAFQLGMSKLPEAYKAMFNAAKNPQAVAVMHYILGQKDAKYREAFTSDNDKSQE